MIKLCTIDCIERMPLTRETVKYVSRTSFSLEKSSNEVFCFSSIVANISRKMTIGSSSNPFLGIFFVYTLLLHLAFLLQDTYTDISQKYVFISAGFLWKKQNLSIQYFDKERSKNRENLRQYVIWWALQHSQKLGERRSSSGV